MLSIAPAIRRNASGSHDGFTGLFGRAADDDAMGFPLCAGCGRTAFVMTSEKKEVSVERVAELCPFVKGMCGWRSRLANQFLSYLCAEIFLTGGSVVHYKYGVDVAQSARSTPDYL